MTFSRCNKLICKSYVFSEFAYFTAQTLGILHAKHSIVTMYSIIVADFIYLVFKFSTCAQELMNSVASRCHSIMNIRHCVPSVATARHA